MDFAQDLEIRCLLSASSHCENRVAIKEIFGFDVVTECPWKKLLKVLYEQEKKLNQKRNADAGWTKTIDELDSR